MEVGVIFQGESAIDKNNNFNIDFRNEEEIIELIFRKNRGYYLTNAIAFVKNKFDKEITELDKIVKRAPKTFPIAKEIGLDYTRPVLFPYRMENHKYKLEDSSKNYLKKLKYFDVDTETVKEFQVYDVLSRLEDGISYVPVRLKMQSKKDNDFRNAVKVKFKEIHDENQNRSRD